MGTMLKESSMPQLEVGLFHGVSKHGGTPAIPHSSCVRGHGLQGRGMGEAPLGGRRRERSQPWSKSGTRVTSATPSFACVEDARVGDKCM